MKILKSFSITLIVIVLAGNTLKAQGNKVLNLYYKSIEKLVVDRNFVFTTNFVGEGYDGRPLLSPDYHLSILDNKILAELPSGDLLSCSSISFTSFATYLKLNSTNYYYKAEAINAVGWRVSIVPINDRYIKGMILNINKKGDAILAVLNKHSKTITYNGSIAPLKDSN